MALERRWTYTEKPDPVAKKWKVYALNLVVLRTHDIERSRRFYEAIGLKLQPFQYGTGVRCIHGSVPADAPLMLNEPEQGIPPPHTDLEIHELGKDEPIPRQQIGFFVGSVDAAVRRAVEAGGTLLMKPASYPYGRRAAVADPDGHRVELSEDSSGRLTGDYPSA